MKALSFSVLFATSVLAVARATAVIAASATQPATVPAAQTSQPGPVVVHLTIHPAPLPVLPLKYRFTPDIVDQVPGNAAPLYLYALELLGNDRTSDPATQKTIDDRLSDWASLPLEELPRGEASAAINHTVLDLFQQAMLREQCHWEIPWRQTGFGTPLPHLSGLRRLARMQQIQARLHLLDSDFSAAAKDITAATQLAISLNDQPLLVQMLVGMSIESLTLRAVDDWVSQPHSPNLYFALSALPHPLVDTYSAMQYERGGIYATFPFLKEAAAGTITEEQWQTLLGKLEQMMRVGESAPVGKELAVAVVVFGQLPAAKVALLNYGFTDAQLNGMKPYQIVAAYWVNDCEQWMQGWAKWSRLPYAQSRKWIDAEQSKLEQAMQKSKTPFSVLVPALSRVFFMTAKLDRRIASLQVIEAIRAYMAAHNGSLPQSLETITEVPVPVDPVCGNRFMYRRTEHGFVLECDETGIRPCDQMHYEIEAAK